MSDSNDIASLNDQVAILSREGRFEEAIHIAQQVVEQSRVQRSQFSEAQALNTLGLLYMEIARLQEAEKLFEKAVEIERNTPEPENPITLASLNNLALVRFHLGRYQEALPIFQRVLSIQEKTLGPDHPDIGRTLKNLALIYEKTGDRELAQSLNERAESIEKTKEEPSLKETARKHGNSMPDPAPLQIDSPALRDQLGRDAFAHGLANRLRHIWKENQESRKKRESEDDTSFVLHLYGPWGSGKSSLLNILKLHLQAEVTGGNGGNTQSHGPEGLLSPERQQERPNGARTGPSWVVIDFNAWQNQRLDPPWWPLLDTVYRQAYKQLWHDKKYWTAVAIRFRELWWRFITGNFENVVRSLIILTVTAALALLTWVYWPGLVRMLTGGKGGVHAESKEALDTSKAVVSTITALAGVLGAISGFFSRPLLSGSARAAQTFVQTAVDPMAKVQRHFRELVTWIKRPIVVIIDDLDRCKSEYVVGLLEGIQTLFKDGRVFYVISADRRWLYCCFEKTYDQFKASVNELGRGLGYLFVEKAVQLSVSVPRLSPDFQAAYWDYLINGESQDVRSKLESAAKEAERDLGTATTEEDMATKLSPEPDPIRTHARREEAIVRLSTEEAVISTGYFLKEFAPLVEPNPRAMKRLLNAYGVMRDEAILAGVPVLENLDNRKQLALWTIVCLRWPKLEEFLVEEPKYADVLSGLKPGNSIPDEMQPLFNNDEVKKVFRGHGVNVLLDSSAIEQLVAFRTSKSDPG
jgi:tetratricopeptide (TPR) repeat protein